MLFSSADKFIGEFLPEFLSGKSKVEALFSTYNTVKDFTEGEVETGDDSLKINVCTGNNSYSPMVDFAMMLAVGAPTPDARDFGREAGIDLMRAEASASLRELENKQGSPAVCDDAHFFAMIYAGLSAFGPVINMALKLREQLDDKATIAILTCDCDDVSKKRKLIPLLKSGQLDAVVMDWRCGGRDAMSEILQSLINQWRATSQTA